MAKAKKTELIPPDLKQCQAEERSFMTLGPGMVRCDKKPRFIVKEVKPGKDGQCGSMSLCEMHRKTFEKQFPNHATDHVFEEIKTDG